MAGFGPKDVDLRGIVTPCSASSTDRLLRTGAHQDGGAAVPGGLVDGGRGVVDVADVRGWSGMCQTSSSRTECSTVASSCRQASGRSRRIVRSSRPGSGRSSRWKESGPPARRKALPGRRPGQGLQRVGQRVAPEAADAEGAGRGPASALGGRQMRQHAVDGADPQRVAGGVDQQDEAVVPRRGGGGAGAAARTAADRSPSGGGRRRSAPGGRPRSAWIAARSAGSVTAHRRWRSRPRWWWRAAGARSTARSMTAVAPVAVPLAAVGEQQRFEVGGGRAHQGGAVLDDLRHDVLVRQDRRRPRPRRRSAPMRPRWSSSPRALLVDVQRRLRVRASGRPRRASGAGCRRPGGGGRPGRRPAGGSAGRCCTGRRSPGGAGRPAGRRRRTAGRSRRRGCRPGPGRSAGRGTGGGRRPSVLVIAECYAAGPMREDRGQPVRGWIR